MQDADPVSMAARPQKWIQRPLSARDRESFSVVAIGASAGGLEACKKLLDALPSPTGMAYLIVQHLDPSHDSLLAPLLGAHTTMKVVEATSGIRIERDCVYIIPPGLYLSTDDKGSLQLSQPAERHGARLPFDFLLTSLAGAYGARAVAVILSGNGADGSAGLKAIKAKGGAVMAQEPAEAGYDGMPRSAIATGAVDQVLPAAKVAAALIERESAQTPARKAEPHPPASAAPDAVSEIIALLRVSAGSDFTHYKQGTLARRIERRMAMKAMASADLYLALLRRDQRELEELAHDLLIHVTEFFRDAVVYERLAASVIPDLVANHPSDRPLRIWVAGCSSGEEAYSLAMLFCDQIAAAKRELKLQIFASDLDADAVASAREGLYPISIEAQVSPARLAKYFVKEDQSYRVSSELRAHVVFTVQDVLADPPFARLDFISCRNLLIYLQPEAQAQAIAVFHFALREGGLLLVGSAEAVGVADGQFEVVSKPERLYRRLAGARNGGFAVTPGLSDSVRMRARAGPPAPSARSTTLAELCQARVLESYGPAAALINSRLECVHLQGPTDLYLKVAQGRPTRHLLAQAREGVHAKLRAAIQGAQQSGQRYVVSGGRMTKGAETLSFSVAVTPLRHEGEDLLLVCFLEAPPPPPLEVAVATSDGLPRLAELEGELQATTLELQSAQRELKTLSEQQMIINEETLSVNEEYQSTNEELLASKEELQSLNEELSALNSQLQETLDRQRVTADDLQNVLYSTETATIFLDPRFNIRLFTPATKALFNLIPSDIGRPLTDLKSRVIDADLVADARKVLASRSPAEREIQSDAGVWFARRILPYRTREMKTEGVVITFENIDDRRRIAEALSRAKLQAESASVAKSRFLAAASHDLRQPLQSLTLLQDLLAKRVEDEKSQRLVARIDEAITAMTSMLNTLLDINQIEVGAVKAEPVDFPVNELLDRLRSELTYQAQAAGLLLRVMPCSAVVHSDPRLIEQMMRNLLSNALKYTQRGRVLVGCRSRGGALRIEVWDTGLGIPASELTAIFEEYHQVDNAARQRSRGLGLGLSIVKSLGDLLNHAVRVRSLPGKGSVFSIEIPKTMHGTLGPSPQTTITAAVDLAPRHSGSILIIEDDPEVRDPLELFLNEEGYVTTTAVDGPSALKAAASASAPPDLVLADYNLPNGMNGVEIAQALERTYERKIPCIILTGDITTEALRYIALHDCVQLNKPAKLRDLTQAIVKLLADPLAPTIVHKVHSVEGTKGSAHPKIYVVDDNDQIRATIGVVLEDEGHVVETYATCEDFLSGFQPAEPACLLIDAYLPGMSGLELLRKLRADGHALPAIMITGNGDVAMAVDAMKAGASDFLEKPIGREELIGAIEHALESSEDGDKARKRREAAVAHLAGLTSRQREVMERVLAGHPSKNIAADLGISQRTVETHRASIMKRTGSRSIPALARLVLIAAEGPAQTHGAIGDQEDTTP